jgi:chromosome segregation ATPase
MKEIIKILIALAFIMGAYILGYHQEIEKHSTKLNEMNNTISTSKENLIQLQDSICKLKYTIDTLKKKNQITAPKKNTKPMH